MTGDGDEFFMQRCLDLAERGRGDTSPNPMVGAVLVHDGQIISEGYHERYGGPHAEVNAIDDVDATQLRRSTLYVNLEPCAHFGKTPPCADLIIEKKIPRVVVAIRDPNPLVAGKGLRKLRRAGVEVKVGVLASEAARHGESFVTFHTKHRPFIAIKVAQTLDGKLATVSGDSKWITDEAARAYAHQLRSRYDAVMIGTGTAAADDPSLTVRLVKPYGGRQPKRIVLDRTLRLPSGSAVFRHDAETFLFTSEKLAGSRKALRIERTGRFGTKVFFVKESNGALNLAEIFAALHAEKILSVMVEGGSVLFSSLIQSGLADKAHIFIAPKFIGGDGRSSIASLGLTHISAAVRLRDLSLGVIDDAFLIEGYF
ncbi:MAG: bifunctional diaminohydroxyphosphoribosylaminopyrimidine deaminase/5-amino-6-(5-phosphoribosylamino)uracil reductase RibD [Rhizobacter sp.]|nr:bifunctional diaminohydroxyphosphoribosylaminopyrimidine deaminase/5-amino-6-(5-phosphoribosylamino)uracil reductase RibD [Chlorobiales bacterium]